MIKIRVELWPGGRPAGMKELGEMTISNIGKVNLNDYEYDVILRDYATMEVDHGVIFHDRRESAWVLLRKALNILAEEGAIPIAWQR